MDNCASTSTPLLAGSVLSIDDCPRTPKEIDEIKDIPYQEALDLLMWLQVATWPDLSYAINVLSYFAHNPRKPHWNIIKHVLGYIKRTIDYRVTYKATEDLNPIGYVNFDFARCCKKAKLQAGIKPTALCSAINKENSIEFLLDFLYYLYNYYMVCALSSYAYYMTDYVASCDVTLWLPVMWL